MSGRDLLILCGMILAVYLPKALPLLLPGDRITPGVRRWLGYVAPAVLSAMVAPQILAPEGRIVMPGWAQLPFLVTLLVVVATRKMFLAVAAGLGTVLALTLLR